VVSPEDIDLVIVPGAAFTPAGARLGLGGGYYDRYLPKLTRARRVALIFDGQVVDQVPVEEHDQFVDELVTEQRSIVCQH
jgi:5-formyltetrahydrofolate cyclo-ligase